MSASSPGTRRKALDAAAAVLEPILAAREGIIDPVFAIDAHESPLDSDVTSHFTPHFEVTAAELASIPCKFSSLR